MCCETPRCWFADEHQGGTKTQRWRISMQVNCSINHTLNQTATDDELRLLSNLVERNFFLPAQRTVIELFVSRKSIENYLNAHTSNSTEMN